MSAFLFYLLQQLHHGETHRLADVHIDLSFSALVAVATAALRHGICVDGRDVTFELRVIPGA
jgi:hypothetical protein